MVRGSGGTAVGASTSKSGLSPRVPREVRASFVLWLVAVGAGVMETIIRVVYSFSGGPESNGLLLRVVVYAVAVYVIAQMRLGKRWARIALAVVLGGIGTFSLVVDPISWLAAGNSPAEVFAEADLLFYFVAPIRAVHLAAVLGALVLMFLPAANDYFRRPSSTAGAPGSPTVTGERTGR
jgi:hypothetical protein